VLVVRPILAFGRLAYHLLTTCTGGIGQPLSLLLKIEPLVTELSLYDIRGAPGVAADVSHVDTAAKVKGYTADQLDAALEGVEVVVIPAGVPRKVCFSSVFVK